MIRLLYNSILFYKFYKRHLVQSFLITSVAERVFNKRMSREVYKRVAYAIFSTTVTETKITKSDTQILC